MTSFTRRFSVFALVLGFAVPAVAGQSANRTSSGVTSTQQKAAVMAEESIVSAKCRQHCAALAASAAHQPHKSIVDSQASAARCLRGMAS
jgi:hypothetical protein